MIFRIILFFDLLFFLFTVLRRPQPYFLNSRLGGNDSMDDLLLHTSGTTTLALFAFTSAIHSHYS